MVLMLALVGLLITSLGFVKFKQIQTAIAKGGSFQPPPTAVTTVVAKQETWSATLDVIGTAVAGRGGTGGGGLPGPGAPLVFASRESVKTGGVLVGRDTRRGQGRLAARE